jgi:hypothetical protein
MSTILEPVIIQQPAPMIIIKVWIKQGWILHTSTYKPEILVQFKLTCKHIRIEFIGIEIIEFETPVETYYNHGVTHILQIKIQLCHSLKLSSTHITN